MSAKIPKGTIPYAAGLAARFYCGLKSAVERKQVGPALEDLATRALELADAAQRDETLQLITAARASGSRPPDRLLELLRELMGFAAMERWIAAHAPPAPPGQATSHAREWLARIPDRDRPALFDAAIRDAAHRSSQQDQDALMAAWQSFTNLKQKESKMAINYDFDPRGLPTGFLVAPQGGGQSPAQVFGTAVENYLGTAYNTTPVNAPDTVADIKGALLLKQFFDPTAFGFNSAIDDAFKVTVGTTNLQAGGSQPNNQLMTKVGTTIQGFRGVGNQPYEVAFQELAFVSQYCIDNAASVPVDAPNFATQVRIGLDKYVEGLPPTDSLDLPPLTGDNASDIEIEPPNVEAVGVVYTSQQLENLRLFDTVDRITELFMHGMVPIGFDVGGKALDNYYWTSEFRLSKAARLSMYGRVLGAAGTDVSKEVQPNRTFDNLLLRFISSLAEYDRQARVADLFQKQGNLQTTGEQVRKAGRDLGTNVSLYGWAGTQTNARRLKTHILQALDILRLAPIQIAFGVSNPYQVIERVTASQFGSSPNIVKYRTMAEAGKAILNLVAKYAGAWSTNTGRPLFAPTDPNGNPILQPPPDITPADQAVLILQATNWLAVAAVPNDQVDKMSQPADTGYSPALPTVGAVSGKDGAGADVMDKLKQMVASGSAPSIEQLQQLMPSFKV